jgi:alkanesulfonate monooxygenase SsuD/methylene tetrahydromethanopterin reductase-like flavin-dependent oxidoreductase (luciferase family)
MKNDLVLDAFGAQLPELIEAAQAAEEAGFDGVWVFDHFSAAVSEKAWSQDPFVTLGAIAASTSRITIGPLVANMMNRHPVQLALGIASLRSVAPGRVLCAIGSGADPTSRFAVEHHAIGTSILPAAERRQLLLETCEVVRLVLGASPDNVISYEGQHIQISGLSAVVEPGPVPPIIFGASGAATIALAARHADGVNIRRSAQLADQIAAITPIIESRRAVGEDFEVSVFESMDLQHRLGGLFQETSALGIDRRTMMVFPPFALDRIREIGTEINSGRHC